MMGPTIEDTFPENAKRPKNCPRFSLGVSSIMRIRDDPQLAPSEIPNKLPATQKTHSVVAVTARMSATIKMTYTTVIERFAPMAFVTYPNRNEPMILEIVDTR